MKARANCDSVKAMVREALLGKAGQDGVTKLKGRSVNEGDRTDCDGDDNDNSDNDDDDALSKAGISQAQARFSIIFGVESIKNTLNGSFKVQEQQARATGLKRRDRLSSRR